MASPEIHTPTQTRAFHETFGWQLFFGIAANMVIGFVLYMISLHIANINANRDRQLANQATTVSDLLSSASDVILDLYPPGTAPSRRATMTALRLDLKKFEGVYWGRLGLIELQPVEGCVTDLHLSLTTAADGGQLSVDPIRARYLLQLKLTAIADRFKEIDNGQATMDTRRNLRSASRNVACSG